TKGTESRWSYIYLDPAELLGSMLPSTWKTLDLSLSDFPIHRYIMHKEEFPQIYQLIISIIAELEEKRPSYQISARGLFLSLFIELYRIQAMEGKDKSLTASDDDGPDNSLVIAPALDYIEENYMQQFSIDLLADLCHWSPTHFRRVFHDIMGTSPLDFINNTRIMKSCNLLRSTEESILDISEQVGFHSVSSFNRYFTKVMQMSPREYRKQMVQSDKRAENQSILEYAGWMFPEK
ncbi:MAG: helix-turn-helix transcriptional regulator, partial [Lachnospiraceae bacterium]|nr:helix-turn-helix transcriptional regulator [Lachnospiraceae bacterium]